MATKTRPPAELLVCIESFGVGRAAVRLVR